ncbi:MAG TPA: hypothetical protein VGF17_14010 [Phytomonospora sp.]
MKGFASAGFLVVRRFQRVPHMDPDLLPSEITTMSECLVDAVPVPGHWARDPWFAHAVAARAALHDGHELIEAAVPADLVTDLRVEMGEWTGATAFLSHAGPPSLAPLGFELVGFDGGTWHSWLCLDGLTDDVDDATGVRPGRHGLIADEADARRAAEWLTASGLGDPKVRRWYPVRLGS